MTPNARRVLLVDNGADADSVAIEIANALEIAGFSVRVAAPAESPMAAARFRPDVAVIALADGGGSRLEGTVGSVVHTLQADHGLPVVVVESDPARGAPPAPPVASLLPAPAPDPAPPMATRVASALRDTPSLPPGSATLEAGDLVVDEGGRLALRADEPLDLTRLEFDLLAYFVRNRNRVLTREALLTSVWHSVPVTPNAIEAVVSKLRTKVEEHGPRIIHTVRGVGYVLRVEGTSPFDLRRHSLLAERERLVRERTDVLARREEVRRVRREEEARRSGDRARE